MNGPLARVAGLRIRFGDREVVRGIDLELRRGCPVGLLGESGSGKTLTGRALLGLLPRSARASGSVSFGDQELLHAGERAWRSVRGHRVGLIAQDPRTALNPLVRVGDQVAEPLRAAGMSPAAAADRAVALLGRVRLPEPAALARRYPGALSGGQRQRIGIAMALAAAPDLLVADEPTSSLDTSVQAGILPLLAAAAADRAMLFITHDIAVAAALCAEIVVLRAGEVVDAGPTRRVIESPAHPYVEELLAAGEATALPAACASLLRHGLPDGAAHGGGPVASGVGDE